jgi:Tfp pilus assembly protein PilV
MITGHFRKQHVESRYGLTLTEVTISTLLIGVLMVASLRTVESSLRNWNTASSSILGTALARQLLDEIQTVPYEDADGSPDFGLETGEATSFPTRARFDDIDDYDAWSASPPLDRAGNALADYSGWSRSVSIRKLAASNHAALASGAADEGLREILVTATAPTGESTTLRAWRTRVGGMQQTLGVDQTIVTWIGCTLQVDRAEAPISGGTLVSNHAEDHQGDR